MIVLGAGMAGCITAMVNKDAYILESEPEPRHFHKALLRFRSDEIGKATGIPFKKVNVLKGIYYNGEFVSPNPEVVAQYSMKVSGTYSSRSISNIRNETRWIAPNDFHEQMIQALNSRIEFGCRVYDINTENILVVGRKDKCIARDHPEEVIISTIPMTVIAKVCGLELPDCNFKMNPILVSQYHIENCDMYCTVYYPGNNTPVYRASITGNRLIIESMADVDEDSIHEVFKSLGLLDCAYSREFINEQQRQGKIVPLPDKIRQEFVYRLTTEFNIYSLGRYANWRNVLLDDIFQDIQRINQMISKSEYEMRLGQWK